METDNIEVLFNYYYSGKIKVYCRKKRAKINKLKYKFLTNNTLNQEEINQLRNLILG